jgi:hypothetical protein
MRRFVITIATRWQKSSPMQRLMLCVALAMFASGLGMALAVDARL